MERSKFINPLFQRTETLAAEVPEQPSFQEPEDIPAVPAERIEPPETVERPKAAAVSEPVADTAPEPAPTVPATVGTEPTVKFTFYFSPSQLRRLDDLWLRAKLEHRQRLNKSEFVRLALDRLMDEFDRTPHAVLEALKQQRG